jgi:hypothetical protein
MRETNPTGVWAGWRLIHEYVGESQRDADDKGLKAPNEPKLGARNEPNGGLGKILNTPESQQQVADTQFLWSKSAERTHRSLFLRLGSCSIVDPWVLGPTRFPRSRRAERTHGDAPNEPKPDS